MLLTLSSFLLALLPSQTFAAWKPFSTIDPVQDLGFFSVSREGSAEPSSVWAVDGPLPTNTFWTNVVLGPGDNRANNIALLPYIVIPTHEALDITYPYAFQSNDRQFLNNFDDIVETVKLTSAQFIAGEAKTYLVTDYDPLSVTLTWNVSETDYMQTALVRGSPYITAKYNNLSPALISPQSIIPDSLVVDGRNVSCNQTTTSDIITGSVFQFSLIQSDATWKLYSSSSVNVTCYSDGSSFKLISSDSSWAGKWRVALVNNCTTGYGSEHCSKHGEPQDATAYTQLIDNHADSVVVGVDLGFTPRNASKTTMNGVTVSLKWITEPLDPTKHSLSEPLMFALPHHFEILDSSTKIVSEFSFVHRNVRGPHVPVVGTTWNLLYPLPDIAWYSPSPIDKDKVNDIMSALKEDIEFDPPLNYQMGVGDPYNAGKMVARMARTILIAEQLQQSDFVKNVTARVKKYLVPWLTHESKNQLIYDKSWGGLISCGCQYDNCQGKCTPRCLNNLGNISTMACPAVTGPGYDFGNAYYNDHHFHYGYLIYAAAVIAHVDPAWADKYNEHVLTLIRDIANPSEQDSHFPVFRYMDVYESHSWALGIPLAGDQPFTNGKDQESTSEAVNAWYAISLYGKAIRNPEIELVGKGLLALEIRGAQTYWQIKNDSVVYPDIYKKDHIMGIIWSHLAQYQTFFSNTGWAIHGIQQLPYTPISEALLDPDWVEQAFLFFEQACNGDAQCTSDGWATFVCLEQSIVDKDAAWKCVNNLSDKEFDGESPGGNGNSRTNSLYFVATRPSKKATTAIE